jgi:hypothetical protein
LKYISAILFSILSLIGLRSGKSPIDTSGLSEASTGFDREHVEPFLLQLALSFSLGLPASSASKLARNINSLWLGQSGNWEYPVVFNGQTERLVVAGFKDDFASPDVYFFSSIAITEHINQQFTAYFEPLGT